MQSALASPQTTDARDFPDWLNPIVVKELRQGLRQMPFTLVFLLAHGVLVSAYVMAFDAVRTGGEVNPRAGAIISSVIFMSFASFGIILQPLRALFTISGETSTQSMDLLLMTRLDPAKIFLGKWLALYSQTLLLAASLLPYLVLRYHLGGMRLFGELSILYWMLFASGILTAVAVEASVAKSKLSKFTLPVVVGLLFFPLGGILFASPSHRAALQGDATAPGFLPAFLALSLLGIAAIRLALHAGAAQISAGHEMGSARVRKAGLALLLLFLLVPGWPLEERVLTTALLSFVLLGSTFVEPPVAADLMARTYVEKGWHGRWGARFFLPGWAHGAMFAPLVLLPNFLVSTFLSAGWSPFRASGDESILPAAIVLPLLPFLPAIIVGMLDLGDKDVLSRATNPFLLGFCIIPAGILLLIVSTPKEIRYIPVAFIYFMACLLLGLMGWEHRHQTNVAAGVRNSRGPNQLL